MVDAIIRAAHLSDAEALHRHCYPDARLADLHDYLAWCLRQSQKDRIVRLVAEVGGQAVGNAQLTVWGHTGEIGSLVVAPAYRCQGLARRLLVELIAEARLRGLAVLEISVSEQQPAIQAFYQRLGFHTNQDTKKGLSHSASLEPVVQLCKHL